MTIDVLEPATQPQTRLSIVDCDVHPTMQSLTDLDPYLSPRWRRHVRTYSEHVRQGLVITLRRSKTDQEGVGRKIGVPHGRSRHCPVAALDDWLIRSQIVGGPIFRPDTPPNDCPFPRTC